MSEMQDYIGFTYNGVHSSDLGIVRTSNGSRFDENLLPTIQDKTVQIPGGDGTYYYGSYYTQRQFSVSFAYDNLSEQQFARLRALFGDKKIHDLTFDERPYKTYKAKVTGTATLKYIPFDEGEGRERVYKGEGTIQFTCYQPYAICTDKWLSDYQGSNTSEWAAASRLKVNQVVDNITYDAPSGNQPINLYNAGDIETHFLLRIDFKEGTIASGKMFLETRDAKLINQLSWSEILKQGEDAYVKFNSKINLIEGYDENNQKTGNVYNKFITAGEFFKIPQGESILKFDGDLEVNSIEYSYYYI